MNLADKNKLAEAFTIAAQQDPTHVASFIGGKNLTWGQMAAEVAQNTSIGDRIVEVYEREMAATGTTADDVLAFHKTGQKPPQLG